METFKADLEVVGGRGRFKQAARLVRGKRDVRVLGSKAVGLGWWCGSVNQWQAVEQVQAERFLSRIWCERHRESGSICLFPSEDIQLQSYGLWGRNPVTSTKQFPPSLPCQRKSYLLFPLMRSYTTTKSKKCTFQVDYLTRIIVKVLTRYLLQKLFGPGVGGVGSFLMGWLGVAFKRDISKYVQLFGHWIVYRLLRKPDNFQRLEPELSVESHWVFALLGFLIAYSIIFGVETAKGFRQLLEKNSICGITSSRKNWRVDSYKRHLLREKFNSDSSEAHLWLGCIVGPLGVWIRWFLARLNGRGLGTTGCLKWVPFGTLTANISAACVMATQSTVKRVVKTKTCEKLLQQAYNSDFWVA
ncbi:hypothetical protein DVH24_006853 [Malus domestica]|uniref:Uncharacterized protein n=1 Tax=Malus domestica TaxID=3750 RepID=A0A498J5I0_MALDO|nr:hypothetical protein DVH24_006853 [Malus domestica]